MIDDNNFSNSIIRDLPIALLIMDNAFRIIEFNKAAARLTGWRREEALGKLCSEILISSHCRDDCLLKQSLATGKPLIDNEAFIIKKNGKQTPVMMSVAALFDDNKTFIAGMELIRDATDIKKLEARKKKLISLFTHDLKAPVAISGGYIDRLLRGKAGELTDKQRDYLEIIKHQVHRLDCYIHAFLDFSKIEAGLLELQLEQKTIENILREAVEDFRMQALDKEIDIHLQLPSTLPMVLVDALQFSRVISNLIDNAVKFSGQGTSILVTASQSTDDLIIEIHDQGPGIARHEQQLIFESFYRIPGKTGKTGGSGLGLATVKAIIEAHGGKVMVHSEIDKGSCFVVSIPKKLGAPSVKFPLMKEEEDKGK